MGLGMCFVSKHTCSQTVAFQRTKERCVENKQETTERLQWQMSAEVQLEALSIRLSCAIFFGKHPYNIYIYRYTHYK